MLVYARSAKKSMECFGILSLERTVIYRGCIYEFGDGGCVNSARHH